MGDAAVVTKILFGAKPRFCSGSGSGYGDGSYWKSALRYFISKLPPKQQERLLALKKRGAKIAYWRSDESGRPCNGGRSDPVKAGLVQKTSNGKLCESGTLHATYLPHKWSGKRTWIVALLGKVQQADDKLGGTHREIIGEIKSPCL